MKRVKLNLIAFISLFIGYGTFAQTVVLFDSDQWTYKTHHKFLALYVLEISS